MKCLSSEDELTSAVEYIQNGKLVIFPTETVYGIGANALNEEAVKNIFVVKGRKQDNPLIVHISNIGMLDNLVKDVNRIEKKLMEKFWPGPLTIILKKKDIIPLAVTCGLDTVGIRMPSCKIARDLIEQSGLPIAAPSANISGKPSGTVLEDIMTEFMDEDLVMIDGGETEIGLESTVVKVVENQIIILRPGFVTKEDLSKIAPTIVSENVLKKPDPNSLEKVESPGMKYRHYAPTCPCKLVVGDTDSIRKKILVGIDETFANKPDAKIVVLYRYDEPSTKVDGVTYISMGDTKEAVSKNMFHLLRKLDKICPDVAFIESVEKEGLGIAIVNRLIRACEYNII